MLLVWPLRVLGQRISTVQNAVAAAERIVEALEQEPSVREPASPLSIDPAPHGADVRFSGVRFGFDESAPVLDGFDLHVEPGASVALVGRTGSGKSTVAALLTRFYDVQAGAVLVDGIDVRELSLAELRKAIALVAEETYLFTDTVRANIAFGRAEATDGEIEAAARAAGAHEFIEELPEGYDTLLGERGYSLSGGQRQRVAIARAILADPDVLVLDDATSSVDATKEHEIRAALQRRDEGPDDDRDRTPAGDDRPRRARRRARGRPHRRGGHARGAARAVSALPGAARAGRGGGRVKEHVWPLVRRRLGMIAAVAVAVLLATAATIAGPLLIKVAIDDGLDQRDESVLEQVALAFLALALVRPLLQRFIVRHTARAGEAILADLRTATYDRLQELSLPYYEGERAGVLVSRLTADVQSLTTFVRLALPEIATNLDPPRRHARRARRARAEAPPLRARLASGRDRGVGRSTTAARSRRTSRSATPSPTRSPRSRSASRACA